ncbi:galactokinase [Suhomyces tanzawaensis NRRL Y-17324]|uniref:Galactokinase n=1 Tax=Suhomyces tanzawaensis NRRL Y-17324 TaxID=984487 RepID=A0A1E4SJ07_9ASCO|nr:galactokinase [Suhomyces tanzawaensis NRRL Y-17324]ODV79489.1 galactokinase [Suhomyces tanzawaensis NRRL Y-17324]
MIPTLHDLQFYADPRANQTRYGTLARTFESNFGTSPQFFARSPGRVNLMGDHIDYNFFSVLPMAIDVDVVVAVSTVSDSNEITITNTNPEFKKSTIVLPSDGSVVTINHELFSWANYFMCGLIVAHKYILDSHPELVSGGKKPLKGLNMTFDGRVPTGGGLSSSAAICVASTLAILRANRLTEIPKKDLTKITVVTEHYIGVNTGGMDQCASIYGEISKALLIQFKPELNATPFKFPQLHEDNELVFLITNSLQVSNKHETAPFHYNLRVVEMAIASDYLAAKLGLPPLPKDSNIKTGSLRGLLDAYFESKSQPKWNGKDIAIGIERLTAMLELLERNDIFTSDQKEGFTTEEAANGLGVTLDQFHQTYLSSFPVKYTKLKLYQRSKHVFQEASKVLQCLDLLQSYNGNPDKFLDDFGNIMNKSQVSLDVLHNSSNKELNEICAIAVANGSYGSRVTGAGWGGSIVHLTTAKKVGALKAALKTNYYDKHFPGLTEQELAEAIVVSQPALGSSIVEL